MKNEILFMFNRNALDGMIETWLLKNEKEVSLGQLTNLGNMVRNHFIDEFRASYLSREIYAETETYLDKMYTKWLGKQS